MMRMKPACKILGFLAVAVVVGALANEAQARDHRGDRRDRNDRHGERRRDDDRHRDHDRGRHDRCGRNCCVTVVQPVYYARPGTVYYAAPYYNAPRVTVLPYRPAGRVVTTRGYTGGGITINIRIK